MRAELLEWSIVSVPADPDALRESHRRMLDSMLDEQPDTTDLAEIRTLTAQLKQSLTAIPSTLTLCILSIQ